ncbi:phasin family protein [Rubrivivax rivuli]|uniref:Poly granule associated protein n=1 Tax=Rubrivivax rivuli TaxID=1862385 RepID=A0A437RLB3_9BURK|nr:phasin family protein [Rubrivivax rivuli]RVU47375.1 poly granule associated protein [Rubrivivax rivuli]
MVKKTKAAAPSAPEAAKHSQLAGAVKDSAQQIWLAGMGAFSKAQEEGTKVFEALVKEGMTLQKKTQGIAEEKISEVTGKMSAMADTVSNKAGQNWDKLESIFEARTAKALNKLGVPTAKDVQALAERVDALAAAVAKLGKGAAPKAAVKAAAKPAAKAVKAKPVAKPAAVEAVAEKAPVKRARKTAAKPAAAA